MIAMSAQIQTCLTQTGRRTDERKFHREKREVLQEFLRTSWPSPSSPYYLWLYHNSTRGKSVFQGVLLSLAALMRAMNSQLFVFGQPDPWLFMTVYHEGNSPRALYAIGCHK